MATRPVLLSLNKAHFPVTTLGPGRRIGLWLQGCSIRCPGCVSQDTWAPDLARAVEVEVVLTWCQRLLVAGVDGVTISGGEPFDQPAALHALLAGLRARIGLDSKGPEVDLLCYSGYGERVLRRRHGTILGLLDAAIVGPYRRGAGEGSAWWGSANQRLVPLSELGRRRYAEGAPSGARRAMQVAVDDEGVWMIGVPRPGDMERLESLMQRRGVGLSQVSWRP
ncbi:MAG TPA: 4Fe-4S cluster-binding domain-containing protein [Actinomycetes bacterium]|nr:4Fe-4S cluster-binding domain-containing protein [Actinomycetes bacterium]